MCIGLRAGYPMTRHFATLFDGRYMPQGLALYESLKKHSSEDFTLHVLALGPECYRTMMALALPHVEVADLESFEQLMFLKNVRASRTWQEYAWTLASVFTESLLNRTELLEVTHSKSGMREYLGFMDRIDAITYLDADVFFFSDPKVIFDRIGERSIGITPHYFADQYKYLERNGKYCVSIVHFKNNEAGRKCASRWAEQVRESCEYRNAGHGRFADQGYLDAWPSEYGEEVCELGHGSALAPWNISAYQMEYGWTDYNRTAKVGLVARAIDSGVIIEAVTAYHFHEFLERANGTFRLTNYPLRPEDEAFFYVPYIPAYKAARERIESLHVHR